MSGQRKAETLAEKGINNCDSDRLFPIFILFGSSFFGLSLHIVTQIAATTEMLGGIHC